MDTPADRASRVLLGFSASLLLIIALSLRSGFLSTVHCESDCTSDMLVVTALLFIAILSMYAYWALRATKPVPLQKQLHSLFSNESELDMWNRLEGERMDSDDIGRMSDAWAKLEVGLGTEESE
mgnify:FL=1